MGKRSMFVGMDVHKESIDVSLAEEGRDGEGRRYGVIPGDLEAVMPGARGRMMTGSDIVRHRDMYQKLLTTMIGYLNTGLGPEDAVVRNPLKEYEKEFGDASGFEYAALRSMMIAYVPD